MSVANILDLPVNTYQKIDPLWDNAGGGGGLFLPLAGGSMDAFPAGVINAHTLTGVINITGAPVGPGNDTVIQTIAGNDLSLQTANTEDVSINTGQLTITAPIRCEINATTVIQPPGGYTYPNNPEIGLSVKNFVNPTGDQIGISVDNISSTQIGTGVEVKNVVGGAGRSYGLYVENVSNPSGNNSYGLFMDQISSGGGPEFGVFQAGALSAGNVFNSKIQVGASEFLFGILAPSLSVVGTVKTSVQLANPLSSGYVIEENAGNICVASGVNNHFVMPTIQYTGAKYTIIKTIPGSIAINGGIANINGVASPPIPAGQFTFSGPAYSQMSIVWIGAEWVATLI